MARDAVIVSTARTPIGRAYKGAFNATPGPTLGSFSLKAAIERAGIDGLIPEGFEATSDQVRARHADDDLFDPTDALYAQLTKIAAEANGPAKSPWYSQLTSFAIFVAGIALLVMNLMQAPQQPMVVFAALIGSSVLLGIWPDNLTRILLQRTLGAVIIPLIPIAIATISYFLWTGMLA